MGSRRSEWGRRERERGEREKERSEGMADGPGFMEWLSDEWWVECAWMDCVEWVLIL